MAGRRILLIEPGYKNKYPPLGLMKIAAYHGPHGKGDHVTFIKGQDPRAEASVWDRVYVTTLFSFEYRKIGDTIDYALKLVGGRADRVFVGGIAPSLMTERLTTEARWRWVRSISGLLTQPPATALPLDEFFCALYAAHLGSTP